MTPDGPGWPWARAMQRCSDPGHRLPVSSKSAEEGAVAPAKPYVQDRGGLLQNKEGKKEVLMDGHYFFFSLFYLVRHRFAGLPLFRLYPGLYTHTQVTYISVILLNMLFAVV